MTSESLRTMLEQRPFRPFTVHLANDRKIEVTHPEAVAYRPGGRTALILDPQDGAHVIDLLLVVELEQAPS